MSTIDIAIPSPGPVTRGASAVVRARGERSDVVRARSHGPLRLLFPRGDGQAAWIVSSNLGGGLVDGDHLCLDVHVEENATCLLSTQSATKVYRGTSSQRTHVHAGPGALVLVVPDAVAPFAGSRFVQHTSLTLDPAASVLLVDVLTAGRVAFGEWWSAQSVDVTLEMVVGGQLRLRDRLLLDAADGPVAARLGRFEALGTVLLAGPRLAGVAARVVREIADEPLTPGAPLVCAASELHGGAMVRVGGDSVDRVQRRVRELARAACHIAGEDPWSRKW